MLRTLQPTREAELLRLCRTRKWMGATLRSQSHPFEATPNEVCLRGEGSTVLSLAVRLGAPRDVLQSLLAANLHQIGITHRLRGSILHDALKHGVSSDVFSYLLEQLIDYQVRILDCDSRKLSRCRHRSRDFLPVSVQSVQENRPVGGPDLLGCQDDLGRTVLHCLVEQIKKSSKSSLKQRWSLSSTLQCIRTVLHAYPTIVKMRDADGNTPLLLILCAAPFHAKGPESAELETKIYHVTETILSASPASTGIARKMPRPWRFHTAFPSLLRPVWSTWPKQNRSIHTEGALTPLYYSILNGRSPDTVKLLVGANHQIGVCGSSLLVTPHHEVCLHIAMTTGAPISVVETIFRDDPKAALVPDVCGLTCIDWLWIRHVLGLFADPQEFMSNRVISRRRLINSHFLDWHQSASTDSTRSNENSRTREASEQWNDLLQRMKILLPGTAAVLEARHLHGVFGSSK